MTPIYRKSKDTVVAIFVIAILLVSIVPVMAGLSSDADGAYSGDVYEVSYHVGSPPTASPGVNDSTDSNTVVSFRYYGVPVAEYNPQFWGDTQGSEYGIVGETDETLSNWFNITSYQVGQTILFTGWTVDEHNSGRGEIDPGYDLGSEDIQWTTNADGTVHLDLYATWSTLHDVRYVDGSADWHEVRPSNGTNSSDEATTLSLALDGYLTFFNGIAVDSDYGPYTSVILLIGNDTIDVATVDKSVTIRMLDPGKDGCVLNFNRWNSDHWNLSADVILDNLTLRGDEDGPTSHGGDRGIFAQGNMLILGTGIECYSVEQEGGVQVNGGWRNGDHSEGTDLRVFSGTYTNIFGGSYSGNITGSTSVMIAGASITDTVYGGSMYGNVTDTNVIIVNGDVCDENDWNRDDDTINDGYRTVIGGSRHSGTVGESYITISGTAKVFAVQGGGRSSGSVSTEGTSTSSTYVTVSGSSTVFYMVCGGVTDGRVNQIKSYYPVGDSHVTIRDSPTVNDVYGGGWDTYNNPVGYSTRSTTVSIEGGTIQGSVYGGGFRGPVGSSDSSVQAVSIEITDGTIQGSVYGGGKGGDDPLRDDSGEKIALGDAAGNTTGRAYVDGDISVSITGGVVQGHVYGGGYGAAKLDGDQHGVEDAASVTGDVTISITGAIVNGAVFGGGRGITEQPSVAAVNAGEIRILIGDGATIGTASSEYSVFGGGATAYTDASRVEITLGPSTLNGDVHAGGFGVLPGGFDATVSTGPIMAHNCVRDVILNGATINGSLYGGSRVGDDAPSTGDPSESDYGNVTLSLEAGVVMENVFGGGFLGESYMNVRILIGSEAVLSTGVLPYVREGTSPDLRINNVFGGGNLNSPGQSPFGEGSELLMGSVEISISGGPVSDGNITFDGYRMPGPGEESDVPKISIYGSIFGQGNFSAIGGASSIEIHDYDQDNRYFIKSIQRANTLTIGDSSIVIEGSGDGLSTSVSVLVSINSITGSTTLEGGVTLGLMAQTSAIGSYASMVNGSMATESLYINGDTDSGNEIVLYDGRLLYILGPNNTGLDDDGQRVGLIEGYTMLSRPDGDNYFGAFAVGSLETGDDSGFIIDGENGPEAASYIEGTDADPTKTWYIAGHISVGMVLTFGEDDGSGGQSWSASGEMTLPHLTEDSKLAYAASYADPTAQDGIIFLDSEDYAGFTGEGFNPVTDVAHRDFFSMTVSGSGEQEGRKSVDVRTHVFNQDSQGSNIEKLGRYYFNGTDYEATGNTGDFHINIDATMLSSRYYGAYGTGQDSVVLGTSGNVGSIIIHLVEVTEYTVDGVTRYMPVNMVDVRVTLNVMPKADELNIPVTIMTTLSSGRYAGTGYAILPAKGSRHTYTISNYTGIADGDISLFADSTHLSNQGWISSDYLSSGLNGASSNNVVIGEGGVTDTAIRIEYTGAAGQGKVTFDVTASFESSTTTYHVTVNLIVSTPVDLGLEYVDLEDNGHKVSVVYNEGQGGYYSLSWVGSDEEADSTIPIPYDSVLTSYEIRYERDGTIVEGTVSEAMGWLLTEIPDYEYEDGGEERSFVYADNLDGWYVEDTLKYELGSPLKESLTLTAKFGIRVTFHGENVTVTHQWVIIAPGTSLHQNQIGNPGEPYQIIPWDGTGDRTGYHLQDNSWVISQDTLEEFDFDQILYADADLYIPWVPNEYSLSISVSDVDPSGILELDGLTGTEDVTWAQDSYGAWTADVRVSYGSLVSASVGSGSYRISSAECITSSGVAVPIEGVPGTSLSFTVPDAGDHDQGSLRLKLTITSGMAFNVDYLGETELTNGLQDGESVTIRIGGQSITFQGSAGQSDGVVVGSRIASFTVDVPAGYWIAIWEGDVLLTEGAGGRVQGDATINHPVDGDTRLTLALYYAVELESTDEGIGEVQCIPVEAGGVAGAQQECSIGTVLFKGYTLIVTPEDGYVLPSTQTGTGTGIQEQISTRYTVLGTVDVELASVSTSVVLDITLSFTDAEGSALTVDDIRELMGSSILITLSRGATISIPISETNIGPDGSVTFTTSIDPGLLPSIATATLDGFSPDSKSINARPGSTLDVAFVLKLVVYDVFYMSLDGSQLDQGTWSVISDSDVPHIAESDVTIEADGRQVWLSHSDEGFRTVERFTVGLFGQSGSIQLFPVPPLTGGSGDVHEHTVVSTQSQLETGVVSDLGDSDFTIVMGGMELSYDGSEKVLTLKGAGTGSFVFQNESVRIRVVSIADLHGDEGVAV